MTRSNAKTTITRWIRATFTGSLLLIAIACGEIDDTNIVGQRSAYSNQLQPAGSAQAVQHHSEASAAENTHGVARAEDVDRIEGITFQDSQNTSINDTSGFNTSDKIRALLEYLAALQASAAANATEESIEEESEETVDDETDPEDASEEASGVSVTVNGNTDSTNISVVVEDDEADTPTETPASNTNENIPAEEHFELIPGWSSVESEVLARVNELRASGTWCREQAGVPMSPHGPVIDVWHPPVAPLQAFTPLRHVAKAHSQDMAERDYFAHNTPEGVTPFQRIQNAGISYEQAGENLNAHWPFMSVDNAINGWLDSTQGHCGAMMHPGFTHTGVGYHSDDGEKHYFGQLFAKNPSLD